MIDAREPGRRQGEEEEVRLYALVEAGDPEAIDVYLCEEDAQRALEDCLRDEPTGAGCCASRNSSSQALQIPRTKPYTSHLGVFCRPGARRRWRKTGGLK
jgi:hypothetical protein